MRIGLCIPWRAQPSRVGAFDVTIEWYSKVLPEATVYLGDEPRAKTFNVSAARNRACDAALLDGCDVLVVSDADVLPDRDALVEAIDLISSGEDMVIPYREMLRLSKEATVDVLNGKELNREDYVEHGAWAGGLVVISSRCFRALNGWDERFMSWGQEDDAFAIAYKTIFGKDIPRCGGDLPSLWHEDRDTSKTWNNYWILRKYEDSLKRDQSAMIRRVLDNRVDWK